MVSGDGAKLSQLSRLLFDKSANRWYGSLAVEGGVALLSPVIAAVLGDGSLIAGVGLVAALSIAYALRLWAEDLYDTAETMRRQAAFSEGLGWPIDPVQFDDWQRKAGRKLLDRVKTSPRPADYYETRKTTGPRKLAEMTVQSAFWTRSLRLHVRNMLGAMGAAVILLLLIALTLILGSPVEPEVSQAAAQLAPTIVLVAIAVDLAGWILRINRQAATIREVERDLRRTLRKVDAELSENEVVRLVTEYDCALVTAVPIHQRIFDQKHDDIERLWANRLTDGADDAEDLGR